MKFSGWMKVGMAGPWEMVSGAISESFAAMNVEKLRPKDAWSEVIVLPDGETPDTRVRLGKVGEA